MGFSLQRFSVLGLGGLLVACGQGSSAPQASVPHPERPARDPELAEVRVALEKGRGDLALILLERIPGAEPECLRARAEFLGGDAVAALAALERARKLDAAFPEMWATEVEILAALERVQAASEVLARGLERLGPAPELLRAQGVLELCTQGHGRQALEALERARAKDPELPFLDLRLAQAHLLVGRAVLERSPAEATAHALAARRLWPDMVDAHELEAEGLTGELRFEEAIARYAELEALGRTFGETPAILHQRCATKRLLEHDRAGAIEHYLAARGLGMDDAGLGFGAEILDEERRAALGRGIAAAEADQWAAAESEFERALELAPGDLEAENHLAVARFRQADYRGAAEAWERVRARAGDGAGALPDPVPLNLAKAWRMAGEPARARRVLSEILDGDPQGPLSARARELLLVLEAEELAGK